MQTKRLIERLSALVPELKAEGNDELALRVQRAITDLEHGGSPPRRHDRPPAG